MGLMFEAFISLHKIKIDQTPYILILIDELYNTIDKKVKIIHEYSSMLSNYGEQQRYSDNFPKSLTKNEAREVTKAANSGRNLPKKTNRILY